ncbi:MAG: hypothetical protein V4608_10870 [Bacteroidota bacterium]
MEITPLPDFKIVSDKLKLVEQEKIKKRLFLREHNFKKEVEYISDQIKLIQEIRYELESVASGSKLPNDVNFKYVTEIQ